MRDHPLRPRTVPLSSPSRRARRSRASFRARRSRSLRATRSRISASGLVGERQGEGRGVLVFLQQSDAPQCEDHRFPGTKASEHEQRTGVPLDSPLLVGVEVVQSDHRQPLRASSATFEALMKRVMSQCLIGPIVIPAHASRTAIPDRRRLAEREYRLPAHNSVDRRGDRRREGGAGYRRRNG